MWSKLERVSRNTNHSSICRAGSSAGTYAVDRPCSQSPPSYIRIQQAMSSSALVSQLISLICIGVQIGGGNRAAIHNSQRLMGFHPSYPLSKE
eukprot:6435445-Amphidinium_carterae.1